jgi:hypothetical protein
MCRAMRFDHLNDPFKLRTGILWLVLSFFVALNNSSIEMFRLLRMKLMTKPLDRTLHSLIQVKTVRFGIKRTQRNNPTFQALSLLYFLCLLIYVFPFILESVLALVIVVLVNL